MGACNVNLDSLRKTVSDYVDNELGNLVTGYDEDPSRQPASSASSSARSSMSSRPAVEEVTGANVLVAIFANANAMPPISCRNRK